MRCRDQRTAARGRLRSRGQCIAAFIEVDQYAFDFARLQISKGRRVCQQEFVSPERMFEPRPFQLMDEHSQTHVSDFNSLEHAFPPFRPHKGHRVAGHTERLILVVIAAFALFGE